MADIFTGRLGGTAREQFPWVFKAAELQGVEALDIEIDHTPGRGWFRASGKVEVRVREPVPDQPRSCSSGGIGRLAVTESDGLEETGFHGEWITWDLGSLGC